MTTQNGTGLFAVDVAVRRDDRIRIAGPNGSGKTILLDTLRRRATIPEERMLVLDEPTNHLDLPSIERLEAALRGYQGALVIVTHDDDVAAAVARTTWEIGPDEGLTQRIG